MAYIEINDILVELLDENKRLLNELLFANNCLTKFIEFKSFIEIVFNKVNNYLEPNDCRRFKDLNNDIKKTFDRKQINNFNQTKCRINFQNEENSETNGLRSEEPIGEDIHILEDNETTHVLEKNLNNYLINNIRSKIKSEEFGDQFNSDEDTDDYEPEQMFDFSDQSVTSDEDMDSDYGPKGGPLKCAIDGCEKIFNSRSGLTKHRRRCHSNRGTNTSSEEGIPPKVKAKSRSAGTSDEKKYICDEPDCDYKCRTAADLKEHQMCVHSDERPFECEFPGCGKTFKTKRYVRKHMLRTHSGQRRKDSTQMSEVFMEKKYVCDWPGCDYRTVKSVYLREHKGQKHSTETPYVCTHSACGKSFKTPRARRKHEKIHSEGRFSCEFEGCVKTFNTQNNMKEHMKLHLKAVGAPQAMLTKYGNLRKEKNFRCEEPNCSFASSNKKDLRRHCASRHSEERPFEYPICHKRYKLDTILKAHMRYHDKNVPMFHCDWPGCDYKAVQQCNIDKHKTYIHSTERNFACDWPECDKRYKSKQDLRVHQKRHNADKRHWCSWPGCQYRCYNSTSLNVHMRYHTNERPYACQWPGCQWKFVSSGGLLKHQKTHNKVKVK